ncbi:S-methyl thiohydantoin desulfurase domain-containing protein [Hornefia butyriciproducens]|uniref:S-methyl thiohydantoin desulfurase domain-containing protein n=1 Tax=Hornefia butyriciproducens TaxID=2652293 RepID=UPI003F8C4503
MKQLTKEDLRYIVYGASFYGGGGGGSMDEGIKLLENMIKENQNPTLDIYSVDEMEDDPMILSTMAAAMGSPIETKGKTFQEEAVNSIQGMAEEVKSRGGQLKYIYSGEMGGGNTLLPLYAAWKLDMPILDVDGNGRAVPAMNTSLAPIHDVATSPFLLASEMGDTLVARTKDPMDSASCEKIARYMCMAYNQGIGFSAWLMNKEDHLRGSAVGQMTKTIEVGKALADSTPDEVLEHLQKIFRDNGDACEVVIADGTITDIHISAEGGFDTGFTTILDNETGKRYTVVCQNENLFVKDDKGKVIITIPSIIALLNMGLGDEVRALSNSETEVGQHVALVLADADKRWYDRPECFDNWSEILESAGYTGKEVRLKGIK